MSKEKSEIRELKDENIRLKKMIANPYPLFEAPKDAEYLGGGMWKKKKREVE